MILLLKSIDPHQQWRDFTCQLNTLETAFDLLTRLVEQGNTLLNAQIIDGDTSFKLPIEAFDTESLAEPMQQLQQEWEMLLAETFGPGNPSKQELMQRLAHIQQTRADRFRSVLNDFQYLLVRAKKMREGPYRARLINHYNRIITRYQHSLAQIEANQGSSF